jgi:hypothetical protein
MIRQCVELGLHKQQRTEENPAPMDEYRKRLFWSVYQLERRTALVLGRPLAITDDEIDINLPQYVEDDKGQDQPELSGTNQGYPPPDSGSILGTVAAKAQAEISFHSLCITLDQLNTKSRLTLCRLSKAGSREIAAKKIDKRFQKLEDWKTAIFGSPTRGGSLRESTDLMFSTTRTSVQTPMSQPPLLEGQRLGLLLNYHRARRMLLQTILTDVHLPDQTFPYSSFAKSSGEVCQLNRRLHRLKPVPFTLLDLHSVFVAGFSMVYCAWNDPQLYDAEMAADFGACSTVLYLIAEQWGTGAKKYRDAFELVAEKTAEYVLSTTRSREGGGQQRNFPVNQQAQLDAVATTNNENVLGHANHHQGNIYNTERAAGEDWGNDNLDVWQMITQSWQTHDCGLDGDTLNFTGMENFLVEEGLGWFHGGTSF